MLHFVPYLLLLKSSLILNLSEIYIDAANAKRHKHHYNKEKILAKFSL